VLAAAFPLVGSEPILEIEQPQRRPRDDRLVEPHPEPPLGRSRKVEAEPRRVVVDVRKIAAAGERVEVGILDEDVRRKFVVHLDADPVDAAESRRRRFVGPREATGMQESVTRADGIGA
jgi:hypothetical protein